MDTLQKVKDFCIRHQTILGFGIVSLLTVGSELIFSYVAFECPCNSWNMLYGCSFLLAPAFVLFLLGFMVNPRTWHLYCSTQGTRACYCQVLLPMTAKASVAPLTWIAVALLEADFYECAASTSSLTASYFCKDNETGCRELLLKLPCDEKLSANFSSEQLNLRAQSQLIGWLLIASIMTVALISKCVRHCCSRLNYLQLKVWKIYTKEEHEVFEKKAKEHAAKLAERNANCFFEATDPAPFRTPSNEDWQKIATVNIFDSPGQYYSRLHKFVKEKGKEKEPQQKSCFKFAKGNEAQKSN